jgi:carbon-monoxide dehydrogenase catalytic subunit
MISYAEEKGIDLAFFRAENITACPIGKRGNCCANCFMGPCRFEGKVTHGICGATKEVIQARNLARMMAAGASAHSDHGRDMAFILQAVALGEAPGYEIRDEEKLHKMARIMEIPVEGRTKEEIALDVANEAIDNFGRQKGELTYLRRAPKKRQEIWKKVGVAPRGFDREVVETFHRTGMGTDQDPVHILTQALRVAMADGWGGSMLATDIGDVLFGTPKPIHSEANLGVLKEDEVNILIHGHEPTMAERVIAMSDDPEIVAYAESKGAKGINIAGLCCTSNESLMRLGVPSAGNMLHQELALATGAAEALVVDVQCVMQGVVEVASNFHTKIITTSPKEKILGAMHIQFDEHHANETAKLILRTAIDNFPNRKETHIPDVKEQLVAGFSHEYIEYMQGGKYRASFRPLNDAIMAGRIRGAVGVVGCNNPRETQDIGITTLVRKFIANDVLVLVTGCSAIACGKHGFLQPEVMEEAGPGLREVCEAIGIPPVLHVGSCVDNSRILTILSQMVEEGGLGDDIADIPAVGICPEWMHEKALAIAGYFVASGAYVLFGVDNPVAGSAETTEYISSGWEELVGGKLEFYTNYDVIYDKAIDHIDKKRAALKLDEYDPNRYAKSDSYLPADALPDEEYKKVSYSAPSAAS